MSGLLAPQEFSGDAGEADPDLAAALEHYGRDATDLAPVVAALARARVLVPVVAVLGEAEQSSLTGLSADKNADMALVLLTSPQGHKALPVFSSLPTLQRWNPQARPVPVASRRAALAGVDEGCDIIVIDPAGPVTAVLNRPATWALGQGRDWVPSPRDRDVVAALQQAGGRLPEVVGLECEPGDRAELKVVVHLIPGLDRPAVDRAVQALTSAFAELPVVAERVASMELSLR